MSGGNHYVVERTGHLLQVCRETVLKINELFGVSLYWLKVQSWLKVQNEAIRTLLGFI